MHAKEGESANKALIPCVCTMHALLTSSWLWRQEQNSQVEMVLYQLLELNDTQERNNPLRLSIFQQCWANLNSGGSSVRAVM